MILEVRMDLQLAKILSEFMKRWNTVDGLAWMKPAAFTDELKKKVEEVLDYLDFDVEATD